MRSRCKPGVVLATGLVGSVGSVAVADFTPGALYVSARGHDCGSVFPPSNPDRIYEFIPATGAWNVFAELPKGPSPMGGHCGISGLTFTPDGSHLRASFQGSSSILELDGGGNWTVALNNANGITSPFGSNNLAYDPSGSLFVVNAGGTSSTTNIMKFAGGAGTGTVFAAGAQGVISGGPIAAGPDGSIYYNPSIYGPQQNPGAILHYAPNGAFSLFDTLPFVGSLATDAAGNLYASSAGGLYRYAAANPMLKSLVVAFPFFSDGPAIAQSASGDKMYYIAGNSNGGAIWELDLVTGTYSEVAKTPTFQIEYIGLGLTMYVPEPTTIALMMAIVLFVVPRR